MVGLFVLGSLMTGELRAQSDCDGTCGVDCDALSARCSDGTPAWWASADAMFLDRSQNYRGVLVIDENAQGAPILRGDALDFSSVAGPRLAVGRNWTSTVGGELVYFGLHDWTSRARVDSNNNLSMPGDLGLATQDFFAADSIRITYGSRIQNAEANLWLTGSHLEWMTGFRMFRLAEDLDYQSYDQDTFQSNYLIQTDNRLYGGQIGVRRSWSAGYFAIRPELKFGVLGNSDSQSTLVRDLDNTLTLRDVSVRGTGVSTLSELRLAAEALLTPNAKINFGYNFLWLSDVAQAPYQLDFTDTASSSRFINDAHSVYYNGVSVGLTLMR